ncbi:MAG: HEAT repeat domain-containing protein [Zavarzinella sp.]|nr:HEAT repeat domain-containing protein [Zavarzinella sp.]
MYADPDVPLARIVKVFPPRLIGLWLQALERSEDDLKCQAAAAIALARDRGMPGLEATVAPLLKALDRPEQHPTVRIAVAQALIALDTREVAPTLFTHLQTDGVEMRNVVDPALARWDYKPARAAWLERVEKAGIPRQSLLLAIRGLGTVREPKGVMRLRDLALSEKGDPIVRLEAARALGAIQTTGLEKDAERLAQEPGTAGNVAQLAAAAILRHHHSDEATKLLQRIAVESEPAAAVIALDGLLENDPGLVLGLLPKLTGSPDPGVRSRAVEAYRRRPAADHIPLVANLLDDPHPQVRIGARKALLVSAGRPEFRDGVLREATRHLATDHWRALEQATILLASLDHKPAAGRFVELLRFERPEVFVAAAWGLRKLAVAETLPAQLAEVERRWSRSQKLDATEPRTAIDLEVSQLAQSLGRARYAPAAPVLARFVPKQWNIGPESRAAAIWALGLIHENAPPERLVDGLIDRLTDDSTTVPEDLRVRRMAAVTLGRVKAKEAVTSLKKYYPRKLTAEPFPNACGWALQQITGEPLPGSGTVDVVQRGWFLEPTE